VALDERQHLGHADIAAELARQRGDVGVVDAARDDAAEPAEIGVAVEREPVHRRAPRDADTDRGDLAGCGAVGALHPDTGAASDLDGLDAEFGAGRDERLFEPAYVTDGVDWHRQANDGVADELARPVPGDAAATVDVDHRGAVDRALEVLGAPSGGEDRRMLQQQDGVGDLVGDPRRVHLALKLPRLVIRDDAEMPVLDHALKDTWWRPVACGQRPRAGSRLRCNTGVDDFRLPGYDIDELLGFGGSGEVWRALERSSGDVVALKRLHGGDEADLSVASDRLRREAALLASVTHDHLVRLRSVVPTAQGLVLVLDYAAGGSLAGVLAARGRVSAGEVVTIGAPLAQALADVHAQGVVHGDVTPGNVLFDANGKPLLADLGVASLAGEQGASVGVTFGYADPALDLVPAGADGRRPGPASDVHGLGAVCFHALAGVAPYADGARARALGPLAPGVPASLVAAIERALDPDPLARPDAATFARMLFASCAPVAVVLTKPTAPVVAPVTQARPPLAAARRLPPVVDPSAKVGGRHRWVARRVVVFRRAAIAIVAVTLLGGAVAAGVGWAGHDHSAAASQVADGGPVAPASSGASQVASLPAASAAAAAAPSVGISRGVDDAAPAAAGDWAAVVGDLDRVRDAAYVDGDAGDLAAVYVPGAAALAADRATLGQLMAAGQRARGLTFQLLSVAVASRAAGQVTLSVRDTLPAYQLVSASGAIQTVAGRGARNWTVVVRADPSDGGWQIASITAAQ
jgi:eukaryotic-like serine/threonine-protein kinase